MSDFLQLKIQRDPGAHHIRIDFAKAPFTYTTARAMAHELWAFGFEGTVGDGRASMHTTAVLLIVCFSRNDDS